VGFCALSKPFSGFGFVLLSSRIHTHPHAGNANRYAPLAAAIQRTWLWILSAGECSLSCQRRSRSGSLAGEGLWEASTCWSVVLASESGRIVESCPRCQAAASGRSRRGRPRVRDRCALASGLAMKAAWQLAAADPAGAREGQGALPARMRENEWGAARAARRLEVVGRLRVNSAHHLSAATCALPLWRDRA